MINYNVVMYIGVGFVFVGFILFLYSQHKLRELDRQQWLSDQLAISFEKGKKEDSMISFTPTAFFCDICGTGGNGGKKCGRGRTRKVDGVKIKYGMNECNIKKEIV